jgi:5-methylcytosine-specific restriction endonuclease McrA
MAKTTKRTGEGKRELLKDKDLTKVPSGKEVHHKKPLNEGGSDTRRNVELISKKEHKKKH